MSFNKEQCAGSIDVSNVSKCFSMYEKPSHRLLQMLFGTRRKMYKEFWALNNVSFTVRKGEAVGIIGKNGAGKSTLLQIICGTLAPTTGDIKTFGRVAALLELGAGFNPEFSGRDNVYMAATLYGLNKEEIDAKFSDIEKFADIGEHIDQPVKSYSSGMYVRLAFSVVAHVDADILIVDEALAVGDAQFTQKCMRFIRKFREEKTLLFVSHDTSAVINLCNRAIWLKSGEPPEYGDAKVISEKYLADLFEKKNPPKIEVSQNKENVESDIVLVDIDNENVSSQHERFDCREEYINNSNIRNDLEIFCFTENDSEDFGEKGAVIQNVKILDSSKRPLSWIVGSKCVELHIEVRAISNILNPIVGFSIKDRLGQTLFGDNTYLSYQGQSLKVGSGELITAVFSFKMPYLPPGDYTISAAVAEGTQDDHVQHHWIHDALHFKSHNGPVVSGLVGIPMNAISLTISS